MQRTEASDWAYRVTHNFGKGYTDEQTEDIVQEFTGLDEPSAERVYSQLKKTTRSTFKISVKEIFDAKMSLGIGSSGPSQNPQFQTVLWRCQACGKNFNFNELPNEHDEYRGVFNFCPHCGFVPRIFLHIEGLKVTYVEDWKIMKILENRIIDGEGLIQSYRNKRKDFFDKTRERDSELNLYREKGIDDEIESLARAKGIF